MEEFSLPKLIGLVVGSSLLSSGGTLWSVNNSMKDIEATVKVMANEQQHIKEDVISIYGQQKETADKINKVLLELRSDK